MGARKHSNIVITPNHRFGFQFCSVSLGVNSGNLQSHFDLSLNLRTHNALDDVSSMVAVMAYLTESDSRLIEKLLWHSYLRHGVTGLRCQMIGGDRSVRYVVLHRHRSRNRFLRLS